MQHLKTLIGDGTVTPAGRKQVSVHYRLKVFGNELSDGLGGTITSVQSIRGSIAPFCGSPLEKLTLQMEGGATLEFSFTDASGNVTTTGKIKDH